MPYTPLAFSVTNWSSPITIVQSDLIKNADDAFNAIISTDPNSVKSWLNTSLNTGLSAYLSSELVKVYNETNVSAVAAAGSASAASTSATNSQLRAWEAEAEKMTSDSYATEAEDVFVKVYTSDGDGTFTATNTTEYSALHWSAKALINASTSATNTSYDNTSSGMVATNVQTAVDEVSSEKANLASPSFTGTVKIEGANVTAYGKNYIINGGFDYWNYATSQTTSGYGSDDRWYNQNIGSTKTHSQVASTDTERALFNSNQFSRTVVASVTGIDNNVFKRQSIENVTKLAGKTVTISFWAKADSSKNVAIELTQGFGLGGTPSTAVSAIGSQLVALTSTWQKKTITITLPSIVGKTLGTDGVHTSSTSIRIWFDAGSNLNTSTASLGQQSGTFDIAEVKLEEGSVATPWTPYEGEFGGEVQACQRYYELSGDNFNNPTSRIGAVSFIVYSTAGINQTVVMNTKKRIAPTVTFKAGQSGTLGSARNVSGASDLAISIPLGASSNSFLVSSDATVSGVTYEFHWSANAEL